MPFGKVQDFSPYIAKIKASGAQSLVTGNYDRDLNLLIKAGVDAGLDIRYDAYLGASVGGADLDRPGRRRPADLGDGIPRQRPGRGAQRRAAEKFVDGFRARRTTSTSSRSTT